MKVTITKQKGTCITEDIGELELGPLTIFAGENNAGKTRLVEAIAKELEKANVDVIVIPAQRVIVNAELETGAAKDPFRTALMELVDVAFDAKSVNSLVSDIEKLLPVEFAQYGVEKTEISVEKNTLKDEDYIKAIREVYIKKLIESITIKDGYSGAGGIEPSDVGQGAQRLIIASLLKYLGDKKKAKSSNKSTYIIFEEPEIYLHPKLKEGLYNTLSGLATSEDSNIQVIITTHDPYFIELGRDFKIYKVFRDPPEEVFYPGHGNERQDLLAILFFCRDQLPGFRLAHADLFPGALPERYVRIHAG